MKKDYKVKGEDNSTISQPKKAPLKIEVVIRVEHLVVKEKLQGDEVDSVEPPLKKDLNLGINKRDLIFERAAQFSAVLALLLEFSKLFFS